MKRRWQRDLENEDLQAQDEAASRHTYGMETQPPDAPPRCPGCGSTALYKETEIVVCRGCGAAYLEGEFA
jgi:hypothetical protein